MLDSAVMTAEGDALRAISKKIGDAKERARADDLREHLLLPIGTRIERAIMWSQQMLAAFPPDPNAPDDEAEVIARVQRRLAAAK